MTPDPARLSPAEEAFEHWRGRIGLVAGPLAAILLWSAPLSAPSPAAHHLLGIVAWVGLWWLSEAIPLAATALVGPALCIVAGIAPAREILRPFSDPVIFLFLGGFLLAEATVKHGLNRRLALGILARPAVGNSPVGVLAGFGVLTALISAWVSNTATAAMVFRSPSRCCANWPGANPAIRRHGARGGWRHR